MPKRRMFKEIEVVRKECQGRQFQGELGSNPFVKCMLLWWLSSRQSASNAGGEGSVSGSGRSSTGGNGYPFQCSCLGNPMDREAWWDTVRRSQRVNMTE